MPSRNAHLPPLSHSGVSSCLTSRPSNRRWSTGRTTSASAVDVESPPITTVASARWTSITTAHVFNRSGIGRRVLVTSPTAMTRQVTKLRISSCAKCPLAVLLQTTVSHKMITLTIFFDFRFSSPGNALARGMPLIDVVFTGQSPIFVAHRHGAVGRYRSMQHAGDCLT